MAASHLDCAGSMMFLRSILSISTFSNSRVVGHARYGTERIKAVFGFRILTQCFASLMRPR